MDYKYPPPPLNMNLTLEVYVFPEHLPYMQLLFTPGPGNRSVKIHNPLDVEVIEVSTRDHLPPFSEYQTTITVSLLDDNENTLAL
ncbi:hypothetical protein Y1Q_0002276 [Alligator mississippiensis]|uniref:Uncharacterized protein n=1 Tax=Alligator mississippiensis TaxID=8496 RepID=A0A151MGK2_ALLMI|nr:hypothetical protein Y1Q_0002276 [Alligator mississippiensis]